MDRVARDRLRWKCRRGLLELDIVLDRFLRRDGDGLKPHELGYLDAPWSRMRNLSPQRLKNRLPLPRNGN